MRIGCQINLWSTDDVAAVATAAARAGAVGLETFTTHLEPFYDDPAKLSDLLARAGIRLSGAYFNSEGFIDPAAEESVLADAEAACKLLAAVGGGFLVVNGGVGKGRPPREFCDADFRQFAKVLNRIGDAARAGGVAAVMHPHVRCMVETPADVDRLLAAGADPAKVGLCVHAAHQLIAGADPYEIYEKHAAWVRYAHVGNSRDGKGCLLGEGVLDQKRLMGPLLAAGFDGWVIVECRKEGVPPEQYIPNAIAYLKATWPEVRWET